MEIEKHQPNVERLERFQSLQAGQYWRAKEQIGIEGIDKDEVLLLESIKWVDDTAHTIVMRSHPLKYGNSGNYQYTAPEGGLVSKWVNWKNHSFLLGDFLEKFEYEPDAEAIRTRELADVNLALAAKQREMEKFTSDPETVQKVVEDGLRKAELEASDDEGKVKLPALSPEAAAVAAQVASGSVGVALVSGMTETKIEMIKAAAAREHQIATIKSTWITEQSKAISETIGRMTPFYNEKGAAAQAQTEDARNYVAKIMSGVRSLDLYIGKEVFVETIRSGDSAAKDEPLTFVQSKLCMDEELALHYDVDEWFDFRSEKKFFEAMAGNDALVRQIFPTDRCVVVMATTRRNINYGDGLTNYLLNQNNKMVFLLVRDGWNIYQVVSPVESHMGASKLFPSLADTSRIFKGVDGNAIKFDDIAFSEKSARLADANLHYKRFLILCAGLDHRVKLFGDFYDERDAGQFVTLAFQERYCRFIRDGDSSASLPTTERQPVQAWIAEKNAYVQSGSRLVCNWFTLLTPETAPTVCNLATSGRNYSLQFTPSERASIAIVFRDGAALCVEVEVSGENRTNYDTRSFNAKVALSAYSGRYGESEEIPFLCLDRVTLEEISWYLNDRGSRTDHIAYIRLFKIAAKLLEKESVDEADTRKRMSQALVEGRVAVGMDHKLIVAEAVATWRAANRGKPLPKFTGEKAPAQWKNVLDNMYAICKPEDGRIEKIEDFVTATGNTPLRIVVTGDARFAVYSSPTDEERDDRFEQHCSVHRISVDFKHGKVREKSRKWVRLPAVNAGETVLKEWEHAGKWIGNHSDFPSLQAKKDALAPITDFAPRIARIAGDLASRDFDGLLADWLAERDRIANRNSAVPTLAIAYPFALVKDRYGELSVLAVGVDYVHSLLYSKSADQDSKEKVREAFLSAYKNRQNKNSFFNNTVGGPVEWCVYKFGVGVMKTGSPFFDQWENAYKAIIRSGNPDPFIGPAIKKHLEGMAVVYMAPDLNEKGESFIDELLGIKRPEGYGPFRTEFFELRDSKKRYPYTKWIDVAHVDFDGSMEGTLPQELTSLGKVCSSGTRDTMQRVETYIAKIAKKNSARAIHHSELPDAPQPPEGVERWFIVV